MRIPHGKKIVNAGSLHVGQWCYPRSNRPSGSFLRTQWQVARRDRENDRILLKLGTQRRFVGPGTGVLIDVAPISVL
jgi:hypothetical protein